MLMNNEPVAWMNAHTGHLCSGGFLMTKMQDYIPLYTHPANELAEDLEGAKLVILRLQAEIEALKAEKIRAYDNGYEDGRKPNTNKAQEK